MNKIMRRAVLVAAMALSSLLAAGTAKAEPPCAVIHKPDDTFVCTGVNTAVENVVTCEPGYTEEFLSGGCYDEEGDCFRNRYKRHVVTDVCQIRHGTVTRSETCVATAYEDDGLCI